ncbi:MAG: hypothetical protein IPH77_15740 [Ignavibacteria bacterium]|nr:hypothetical protein [Ignavibacteria bacterium]
MKITILIISLIISISSVAFSQSVLNYQSGTGLEVQTGASVCADNVIMNGTFTGGGTLCGLFSTLNLTAFMEGFYNSASNIMISDTVRVFLRNATFPYAIIDSTKSTLNSSGSGAFTFSYPVNGVNYFIVIKHRNSIETWSKTAQAFTGGSLTYNFSSSNTQAFGNNMKQIDASPVRFGIYSGDINQDGTIDATDVSNADNDAFNSVGGYVNTDVTGDNFVDAADVSIVDNNAFNSVSVISP